MNDKTVERTPLKAVARHVPGFTTLIYLCESGKWRAQLRDENDRCWASSTFDTARDARRWLKNEMIVMWIQKEQTASCGREYIERVGVHPDVDVPITCYHDPD